MNIAIIGAGVSGLSAAWLLHPHHNITVYEASDRLGGHANTVEFPGHPAIDTGFIVYNEWTYPNLIELFKLLEVETIESDMSFSVSMKNGSYEYSSNALFADRRNFLSASHLKMLRDIYRFYKSDHKTSDLSLGVYLEKNNYSDAFIYKHILPMAAAIWSSDITDIRDFPVNSFIDFFQNHGLMMLNTKKRPMWRTVQGGSREYIYKLAEPFSGNIRLNTPIARAKRYDTHVVLEDMNGAKETYDHVIMAIHSDQALSILSEDMQEPEANVLGAFPYKENIAVLHQDDEFMPKRKNVWASWNFVQNDHGPAFITYWMNKLQPYLGEDENYFVTINPPNTPRKIFYETSYAHPQYLRSARDGWKDIRSIQGKQRVWFCGAWCGYGFHEDGLSAGLAVAEAVSGIKRPWSVKDKSPAGQNATGISF